MVTLWIIWAAVAALLRLLLLLLLLLLTLAMSSSHTVYRVLFGPVLLRWLMDPATAPGARH